MKEQKSVERLCCPLVLTSQNTNWGGNGAMIKNRILRNIHVRNFKQGLSEGVLIFMPLDRMIGGILFLSCLFACLSVCLFSTLTFDIIFEP